MDVGRFTQALESRHIPSAFVITVDDCLATLKDAGSYVKYAYIIAEREPPSDTSTLASLDHEDVFVQALAKFGQLHNRFAAEPPTFNCDAVVPFDSVVQPFQSIFSSYVQGVGQRLHQRHMEATISALVRVIMDKIVTIKPVAVKIAQEMQGSELYELVVSSPKLEEVSQHDLFSDETQYDEEVDRVFDSQAHHQANKSLQHFAQVMDLQSFPIPGAYRKDQVDKTDMPIELAQACLDITCLMRDIAEAGAAIHMTLYGHAGASSNASQTVDSKALLGYFPKLIRACQRQCASLLAISNTPACIELEKGTWHVPLTMEIIRSWVLNMQSLCTKAKDAVLKLVASYLSDMTTESQKARPTWEACFQQGDSTFDIVMAAQVAHGKRPVVVDAHNKLHAAMTAVGEVGRVLAVTPLLKDHATTKIPIRVANSCMSSLSATCTWIQGVEVLLNSDVTAMGPRQAKSYYDKYHQDPNLKFPEVFWHQFDSLSKGAAVPHVSEARAGAGKKNVKRSALASKIAVDERPSEQEKSPKPASGSDQPEALADGSANDDSVEVKSKSEGARVMKRMRRH